MGKPHQKRVSWSHLFSSVASESPEVNIHSGQGYVIPGVSAKALELTFPPIYLFWYLGGRGEVCDPPETGPSDYHQHRGNLSDLIDGLPVTRAAGGTERGLLQWVALSGSLESGLTIC